MYIAYVNTEPYPSHSLSFFFSASLLATEKREEIYIYIRRMLRYPSRVLTRTTAMRGSSATMMSPVMLTSSRQFTDKLLIGAISSCLTCSTTLGLFHLLVTPVTPSIAAATVATATATGACVVIDGGSQGGSSFGAVAGVFVGAMGGFYAKSQKEPWRK